MSGERLKRILFVLLLLSLSVIWLYNLTLFLPKSESTYYKTTKSKSQAKEIIKASTFDFDWGYRIKDNLPDPFKPFYKKSSFNVQEKNRQPIKPEIVFSHPFKYIGLIKGKRNNCGILIDRSGKTYAVVPGDTLEMTTIIKINEDILELRYQGKVFELKLNE